MRTDLRELLTALGKSPEFQNPLGSFTDDELTEAFVILHHLNGLLDARTKAMRVEMLSRTEKDGAPTDKGGQRLRTGAHQIIREKRDGTFDLEKITEVLRSKGLDVKDGCVDRTVLTPDPGKLDYLVMTGKLTQAEVDSTRKTNYALKPVASYELRGELDKALPKVPDFEQNRHRDDRRP